MRKAMQIMRIIAAIGSPAAAAHRVVAVTRKREVPAWQFSFRPATGRFRPPSL